MATSRRTNIDALIAGELQSLVCLPDTEIAFSPHNICDAAQHRNGCAAQAYQTSRVEYFRFLWCLHSMHVTALWLCLQLKPRLSRKIILFLALHLINHFSRTRIPQDNRSALCSEKPLEQWCGPFSSEVTADIPTYNSTLSGNLHAKAQNQHLSK